MGLPQNTASTARSDVYTRYLVSVQRAARAADVTLLIEQDVSHGDEPLVVSLGQPDLITDFSDQVSTLAASVAATRERPALISYYPGDVAGQCIMRIAADADGVQLDQRGMGGPPAEERRQSMSSAADPAPSACVWVGLYFDGAIEVDGLAAIDRVDPAAPQDPLAWLAHTLIMGAGLVWEAGQLECLLRDPTSQLPGRAEFQSRLKLAFLAAGDTDRPLGLLLVNPDDFGNINERLGRENGDRAVAEVAQMLRGCLRQSDRVFRYGGAVFAVLMPVVSERSVDTVATKVRQALTGAYLDGAVRLAFSVGGVVYDGSLEQDAGLDELGLLRRAEHALNLAKRAGGGCSVIWSADAHDVPGVAADRLSGIFTANAEKDYRNMLLLWDTIAVISSNAQKQQIASEFVARINLSLKPDRVALFERAAETGMRRVAVAQRSDTTGRAPFELTPEQQALLDSSCHSRRTEQTAFATARSDHPEEASCLAYAVPILAGEQCLGCLYLDGPANGLTLDSSDLVFLDALAGQLGLALDRVELAARWREETERESQRLREEVHELRQVVHSARMVYSSRQMHGVLDTLRAVAQTDVTILINGESGTGKEMLARATHEMSGRKDQPLVTVDCGTIAQNLMEAELFGYVKGAYTGAHATSEGRIAQAQGGTLFLDEIGEVPLDVQAKLLRFVQEKEINPVGANSSRKVDTRIVAATNRDLAAEVAAGRFREDLYYRLKVVTVTSPPLRERPDDILPLAQHFLGKFALQYEKRVRRFSAEAEFYMQQYQWPGNVRELQNCILRAVVLCQDEAIPVELLQSASETAPATTEQSLSNVAAGMIAPGAAAAPFPREAPAPDAAAPSPAGDPWEDLQRAMVQQVEIAMQELQVAPVPLGRWLNEDLVLATDTLLRGNARQAAARLQVAETTYRRQLQKVQLAESQGLRLRSPAWESMEPVLDQLVKSLGTGGDNVIERCKCELLAAVHARVAGDDNLGAGLMGVTVPTYRRWAQKL